MKPCDRCHGTLKWESWDGRILDCDCKSGTIGTFNKSADIVKRTDVTYSDTNLHHNYPLDYEFTRLICGECGATDCFEVLKTDSYETTAKCMKCGAYYIVHNG